MGTLLYGPESEVFNQYAAVSPAPGDNGSGGQIAQRGVQALGQQLILADGSKFRFARAGELLVLGEVLQAFDTPATDISMAAVATAIGSRTISFTHGGATTVINFFAEGWAIVSLDPGQGNRYKIASHLALTSGGADVVNLAPGHAVRGAALTTTSDVTLVNHVCDGVITMPATPLAALAGVAVLAIASGSFGWIQTRGIASVIMAASTVSGNNVGCLLAAGTAGAVAPLSAATQPVVGVAQVGGLSAGMTGAVNLMIDG
ncbi:hypothetical protein LCGC14_2451050 [marine sediment metagenome]|uniref:Uncharacterized protein n=1 Tax=marine sediment metagenome TaxID=412755 RepID=A0A0F9DT85_9ZZZZ